MSSSDAREYVPDDPDFLCKPPKDIGEIVSKHSSLSEFDEPPTAAYKLVKAIIISGVIEFIIIAGAIALVIFGKPGLSPWPLIICGLVLTLFNFGLVFGFIFGMESFSHFCAYVGEEGAAYYSCAGSRENINIEKEFRFEEARDLRIATTHHYTNGAYQHTAFSYIWTDEDDQEVFSVVGSHGAEFEPPPETNVYYFAVEAEEAWSLYLLAKVLAKLKKGGSFKFRLKGSNYLTLGDDYLKLNMNGSTQEFEEEDLEEITIANGEISIKEPGAKKGWFTDTGIHVFSFAELSNARVFLLLLNNKFGVPIS